jgi:cytochrome c
MKSRHAFILKFYSFVIFATFLFSSNAQAVDVEAAKALAKQNNCFRCHGVDKDKDGPAWNKVSAKYKGDAKAEEKLLHHLSSGEPAKFPDGHEEAHAILKSDDANALKNLVDWILSL